jgi:hypothetical protein
MINMKSSDQSQTTTFASPRPESSPITLDPPPPHRLTTSIRSSKSFDRLGLPDSADVIQFMLTDYTHKYDGGLEHPSPLTLGERFLGGAWKLNI